MLDRGLVACPESNERIECIADLAPIFGGALGHAIDRATEAVLDAGNVGGALVIVEKPPVGMFRHHLEPALAPAGGEYLRERRGRGLELELRFLHLIELPVERKRRLAPHAAQ